MKFEWKNFWMHKEWQPMSQTNYSDVHDFLESRMPYTEDGTKVRVDNKKVYDWPFRREQFSKEDGGTA